MPRWVRVLAVIGAVLVVLLVVMLLTGHGPAQHVHNLSSSLSEPVHVGEPSQQSAQLVERRV